ncbi:MULTISPECIES: MFS transporter [unclassified Streptomyces]|uniref:MFS transporter n=1 Tax=unclassified Streptomyces TaxID=2593676 RepID=UPI0035E07FBA
MSPTASTASPPRITYGAVLGSPYVARLLGSTLTGRLPNGMAPVAIVLWTLAAGRGIALGGLLSALYGLASALSQPVKGRMMDRYGQSAVHLPAAVLNSSLLIALPLAAPHGGPALATTIVVAAAGLTALPLEAGLRALWPSVLPDLRLRHAALALDTGTQGLLYIVGPLLVAALSSTYSPATALTITAALGLAGTLVVATAPPSRRWRPAPTTNDTGTARQLASPQLTSLFAALAGVGCAIGALNVLAVTMSDAPGRQTLSGLLPAAFSAGSFLGALVYGSRNWPGSTTRQLIFISTAFLVGWLPLLAIRSPYAATAAVALPGAFLTVVVACAYVTTDALTPTGRTSEAYAWLICSIGVGQAAGTALAGRLADHALALAALPAAGATFALTVLLLTRPDQGTVRRNRHRCGHA